ncbi:MAG TPA: hypothetical protein VJZ06_02700, partial [Mobilitalea sp.]|nr:hypothetical protein [Mobilitalea sp.]
MIKTLWSRLIICYLIAVTLVFVFLNTYGMHLLEKSLKDDQIDLLMKEAVLIESEYQGDFIDEGLTLDRLATQFKPIDTYLNIRVWIVNKDGEILIDSASNRNASSLNLNEIDASFLDGNQVSYDTKLKGIFNEPMLSYINPVNSNFQLRGYIVLHSPITDIENQALVYFDVINICFLVFFPLLLLLFLYIHYFTATPMKRLA